MCMTPVQQEQCPCATSADRNTTQVTNSLGLGRTRSMRYAVEALHFAATLNVFSSGIDSR